MGPLLFLREGSHDGDIQADHAIITSRLYYHPFGPPHHWLWHCHQSPQEHQAIQTYAQSCGRMPDALRNAPSWGRWRELIERAHTQSEQLDPPGSLREFHQVRLQWFGNMLHLASGQSDDAEYDRSVFTTDPSFQDQLIGYFQAWVDLPRDTRDILRNNVCFPETDISTDTNDLKSVQEYASACYRTQESPQQHLSQQFGYPFMAQRCSVRRHHHHGLGRSQAPIQATAVARCHHRLLGRRP